MHSRLIKMDSYVYVLTAKSINLMVEINFTNPSNTVAVTAKELNAMKKYGVVIFEYYD